MKTLKLADALDLPLDAITEKIAWLGRTGSGKTYGAMRLAESMLDAGAQIVALDFVGAWYGLRVPGAAAGFPIPVFGGLHGDYPLEATGGALVADLIVDRAISAVVDVSQFTRADQIRFCLAFATQFFQRQKVTRAPVHLFLEECQEVLPQNAQPNEGAMLGAFERIWKLGRNFGIGGSLISQRPQEVNKKALNMSGTLFVFQMTGPQERKTIESWVTAQGLNDDIVDTLPRLERGQPHAWSVAFGDPVSKTVRILKKQTGDVSATPTGIGTQKQRPLTPIDAPAISEAMRATVERSKAEDPKELRKELARVLKELEQAQRVNANRQQASASGTVPALTDADRALLASVDAKLEALRTNIAKPFDVEALVSEIASRVRLAISDQHAVRDEAIGRLDGILSAKRLQKIREKIAPLATAPPAPRHNPTTRPQQTIAGGHSAGAGRTSPSVRPARERQEGEIAGTQQRILDMIATLDARGFMVNREMLARWLGLHPNGGRFNRDLAQLRAAGHLDGLAVSAGTPASPHRTGFDAVIAVVEGTQARILETVREQGPLSREELADRLGLHPNGGRFNRDLAWLRTMGVIPERGAIAITPQAEA